MVKKFTLSVSDELAEKIEAHRDHLGNLSGIFQEAVSERIEKREGFKKRLEEDEDMEAIIERLREEKAKAIIDYHEKGKLDGLKWAKTASYVELEYAADCERHQLPEYHGGKVDFEPKRIFGDPILGKYFSEAFEADRVMTSEDGDDCFGDLETQWIDGWLDGVYELWEHVKDKL